MATDINLTPSQVDDPAAAYLAEVRKAAALLAKTKAPSWGTLPRIQRMIGYAERLAGGVEIALAHHQDDGYGRCVTCLEHCTCVEDAYGSLPVPVPQATGYAVMARAWEDCPHGNGPWPCKEYRDITAELTKTTETPDAS